jgi:translation initiation factor IF-3
MKQMKFAYGIGDNDLNLKIVKVKEMLEEFAKRYELFVVED